MKKTLKATVPNLILKLLNKEFNALNMLESWRFVFLQKKLLKAFEKYVKRNVRVLRDIMVINAKQLQTKVEKNATDISKGRRSPHNNLPQLKMFPHMPRGSKLSLLLQTHKLAELKAKKEKTEKRLKKLMTLDELRAHVEGTATYEAKRARMLEEYNHCFIHGRPSTHHQDKLQD
ncbi:hypothetical protein Tco_0846178 [Tanacetum coccineum]